VARPASLPAVAMTRVHRRDLDERASDPVRAASHQHDLAG
jgi:hypothetical protein